jgi:hypothetical protein
VVVIGCLLVFASAVAVRALTPAQVASANRIKAVAAAERVLGEVVLPAGSTEVTKVPTSSGLASQPFLRLLFAAQIDRHAFWTPDASPSAVIASVTAHLSPGAKPDGSGHGGSERFAAFTLPRIEPAVLAVRQLVIEAISLPNGTTAVRADGEVQYIAPRPRSEQVPRAARVLKITMTDNSPKPLLSLTVTNRARIRQIARLVNALPFAGNWQGIAFSCPASSASATTDTFVFRAASDGPALARVTESAATPSTSQGCLSTTLTIRGHRQPELMDGGVLLHKAGSLLGVKLTRS